LIADELLICLQYSHF